MADYENAVCVRNWRAMFAKHKEKMLPITKDKPELLRYTLNVFVSEPIECWNGLKLSIQASGGHYCDLRPHILGGAMAEDYVLTGDETPLNFEVMIYTDAMKDGKTPVLPYELLNAEEEPAGWVDLDVLEKCIHDNGGWVKDPEIKYVSEDKLAHKPRKLDL